MPKINGIHYCKNCNHKIVWECRIPMKSYGVETYSFLEDTYKPKLLNHDNQIATMQFTCKNCGYVDAITYNTDTPRKD